MMLAVMLVGPSAITYAAAFAPPYAVIQNHQTASDIWLSSTPTIFSTICNFGGSLFYARKRTRIEAVTRLSAARPVLLKTAARRNRVRMRDFSLLRTAAVCRSSAFAMLLFTV
jgi:hypothetical protein